MFHVKQKRVAFRSPAGACLLCRLLPLPLVCFLPPSPRPPSPVGKGEIFGFFMQGAPPLASPGLSPGGTGYFLPCQCFLPPPPRPPSRWEGGDFWFSYARGSAPCIPGAEPARRWLNRGGWRPGTPAAKPARHWLFSAMSVLFYPHPPCPLPGGKGETKVILCKGLRPLHPRG